MIINATLNLKYVIIFFNKKPRTPRIKPRDVNMAMPKKNAKLKCLEL